MSTLSDTRFGLLSNKKTIQDIYHECDCEYAVFWLVAQLIDPRKQILNSEINAQNAGELLLVMASNRYISSLILTSLDSYLPQSKKMTPQIALDLLMELDSDLETRTRHNVTHGALGLAS
mgnify:CR=1 FL=1